jgi:hypothetical protein
MRWAGVKNGELLRRAALEFDAFITLDQSIEKQQVVPADIALVTLEAPSNRIEDLVPLVPALLRVLETERPGDNVRVQH